MIIWRLFVIFDFNHVINSMKSYQSKCHAYEMFLIKLFEHFEKFVDEYDLNMHQEIAMKQDYN